MTDQPDPYVDLRRTTAAWLALPSATSSIKQGGHTSSTGRHHPGPGVECPEPWCAYIAAANPDTIARLLAERDRLHGALHMACSDGWADGEGAMQGYLRHGAEMGPPAPTAFPNPEATR